jgi:hypothetical protein
MFANVSMLVVAAHMITRSEAPRMGHFSLAASSQPTPLATDMRVSAPCAESTLRADP